MALTRQQLTDKINSDIRNKTLPKSIKNINHADIEEELNQRIGDGGNEEYDNLASFPATGQVGKQYLDKATNSLYRWTGSVYVQIGGGGGISNLDIQNSSGTTQFTTDGNALKFNQSNFSYDILNKTIDIFKFGDTKMWYIATNGNDSTGQEGNPNRPFLTFAGARAISIAKYGSVSLGTLNHIFIFATGSYSVSLLDSSACTFVLNNTTITLTAGTTANPYRFIGFGRREDNILTITTGSYYFSKLENITVNGTNSLFLGGGEYYNTTFNSVRLIGVNRYYHNCTFNTFTWRLEASNIHTFDNCVLNNGTDDIIMLGNDTRKVNYINTTLNNCTFGLNSTTDSVLRTLRIQIENCKINNSKFRRANNNTTVLPRILLTYKNNELVVDNFIEQGNTGTINVYAQYGGVNLGTFAVIESNPNIIVEQVVGVTPTTDANFILI